MTLTVKIVIVVFILIIGVGGIIYVQKQPSKDDKKVKQKTKRKRKKQKKKKTSKKSKKGKTAKEPVKDETKDKPSEKKVSAIKLDTPFESLITPTYLEQSFTREDRLYQIDILVNNEPILSKVFNTTFAVEIFGRFMYGGEMILTMPSQLANIKPRYLPFNGNRANYTNEEGFEYENPCKRIDNVQFKNSMYGSFVKTNNTLRVLSTKLKDLPLTEAITPKGKDNIGRYEMYVLAQIIEYLFLIPEERKRDVNSGLFENFIELLGDIDEDKDEVTISLNRISDSQRDNVKEDTYIIVSTLDRWTLSYLHDMKFAKNLRELVNQITDVLDKYKNVRKKEDQLAMKQELGEIINFDLTHFHIKEVQEFMEDYIQETLNSVLHFRERVCIARQAREVAKGLDVFKKLPKIDGL